MTDTPISQPDIEGLAAKLDGLNLPAGQKAFLSAMVTLAARTADRNVRMTDPVPSFRDQFAGAFTPGVADDVVHRAAHITR